MCGIAGYYYKRGKKITETHLILDILRGQRHRGPDDSGVRFFSLTDVDSRECPANEAIHLHQPFQGVLGFNRLSILDLSPNGHQPMCSPDEKVILCLNGEIYNAFDFKDELIADGIRFKSTSDTEVVLYLYMKYGFDRMVKRLNGMFAVVVVDLRQQKMFFARDRFGIKPLYFFERAEMFAFASEIKGFLPIPEFKAQLNRDLLDEYLLFRNTLNQSLFRNVESLEPGTYRVYTPLSGFETIRYFDIESYRRNGSGGRSFGIGETLRQSVKRQLMSDVKLGCQLSGGVDSSLVTYFAKEIKKDDLLETVSIVMDDPRFSEEPYMDHVTSRLGLVSHKFRLDEHYYLNSFQKAAWHFEGPLNHPNTIGIYLLSQRAKEFVTVLLSGEGADEVFGGYRRFAEVNHPFHLRSLLGGLRRNQAEPFAFLSRHLSESTRAIMGSAFMTPSIAGKVKPGFKLDDALRRRRKIYNDLSGSPFDRQVKYEIKTYLPDLLARQDKMSMAHSIENRVPFLDNELVEHAFAIAETDIITSGHSEENIKIALKNLAAGVFGRPFAFRAKQGFGIPLRAFFLDSKFSEYLNDHIVPGIEKRRIFNAPVVGQWVRDIGRISTAELDALWIMVSFEAWAHEFKIE